jgi:pyruvate formate lyase activating enzyme
MDCVEAAHDRGLKTVGVTAGYISPAARPGFFRHLDAANVDLKAFTQGFYGRLCFGRLQPVLDTLVWLKQETRVWLEVTTLLIPGENDSESEIEQLSRWFLENLGPTVPLHFTAFHPDFKLTGIPRTPASTLLRARRQALAAGLHHVYVGNLSDSEGQDTSCHACGTRVIQRQGYTITGWDLRDEGSCRKCGNPIPGHFSCAPDTTPRRPSRCRLA